MDCSHDNALGRALPAFAYAAATAWLRSAVFRAPALGWAESAESALLLMTGKTKKSGKNKRKINPANHGARPCNHTARRAKVPRRARYKG